MAIAAERSAQSDQLSRYPQLIISGSGCLEIDIQVMVPSVRFVRIATVYVN